MTLVTDYWHQTLEIYKYRKNITRIEGAVWYDIESTER